MEGSLRNAEQAKQVLDSMYLVQEFIDGGNLRKQVLEQVVPTNSMFYRMATVLESVCSGGYLLFA